MLARGVSRYHPDLLAAIACAASATTSAAVAAPKQSCVTFANGFLIAPQPQLAES
jgi:hypothetical protein